MSQTYSILASRSFTSAGSEPAPPPSGFLADRGKR